jgi:putative membrane protein
MHTRAASARRTASRLPANPLLGAAAGGCAGLIGAFMMVRFQHLIGGNADDGHGHEERRAHASPNDTDATFPDEPATIQVASLAAEAVTGSPLEERGKRIGGSMVHYGFSAAVGALYGAAAESYPGTTALSGLPFGAALWVAADEVGVPLAGLARDPKEYPAYRHLTALASHLVFGLTVEGVRRALRGSRRSSVRVPLRRMLSRKPDRARGSIGV